MNMRQMKNSMKLLVMAMRAVAMGMVGCSSKPAGNSGTVDGDGYPMPNMQQACMNRLNHILMSDEGRAMTGKQLAELTDPEKLRNAFQIALPVCDDDQLPCMGTYLNEETGGTIVFSPITVEDPLDTIHARSVRHRSGSQPWQWHYVVLPLCAPWRPQWRQAPLLRQTSRWLS